MLSINVIYHCFKLGFSCILGSKITMPQCSYRRCRKDELHNQGTMSVDGAFFCTNTCVSMFKHEIGIVPMADHCYEQLLKTYPARWRYDGDEDGDNE